MNLKARSIWWSLFFVIITFGIYGIVWYCSFMAEVERETGNKKANGFVYFILIIITIGIYYLVRLWKTAKHLKEDLKVGSFWVNFILGIFLPIVAFMIMQHDINMVLEKK